MVDIRVAVAIFALFTLLVLPFAVRAYKDIVATYFYQPDYAPLLNTIARGESRGNYNAYYGNTSNVTLRFTDMSIANVIDWQEDYIRKGSPSSAVGKYQIVRPTLIGLVQKLHIDPRTRFDEKLQDRLAVALLERRGIHDYLHHKLSRQQFASNLSQEWAALPRTTGPNPTQSYYAGDGLNKVQVSIDEVYKALATLHS